MLAASANPAAEPAHPTTPEDLLLRAATDEAAEYALRVSESYDAVEQAYSASVAWDEKPGLAASTNAR